MEEIKLELHVLNLHWRIQENELCFPGVRTGLSLASIQYIDNYIIKLLKAAYIVLTTHPFNDGNKRVAFELVTSLLDLRPYYNEIADIILKYASNSDTFDNFAIDLLTLYLESLGIDNPSELIPNNKLNIDNLLAILESLDYYE